MMPQEIRTAGWVNKRRSGQRRGYCDRGLGSMEFPGSCKRIGRMSLSGGQRKGRDRKRKGAGSKTTGVNQDRLVKKLRRKGIQDYEAANVYLQAEYLPEHNRRFAREAARPEDYHVRSPSAARLREVFRLETER